MTQNHLFLLKLLASAINNNPPNNLVSKDLVPSLLYEANAQAVLPLVYSQLEKQHDLSAYANRYYNIITSNAKVNAEHKAVHTLLTQNGVPYVILKGCASAEFYPTPFLRTMGDVDIYVKPEDFENVRTLLLENGYEKDVHEDGIHISFLNPKTKVTLELHRRINGIPEDAVGKKIVPLFDDVFEKAVLVKDNFYRPSDFHHGLILLLHKISHITKEGVGLRQFCDWAVFAAHFSDDEFCSLFEKPLKAVGLWKFAQIATKFAVKFLGCPQKNWCEEIDDTLIDSLADDILDGGNFGKKDISRRRHIKYISSHQKDMLNDSSTFKNLVSNAVAMAKKLNFVKKLPILLPVGLVVVTASYFLPIIFGNRKADDKHLRDAAFARKDLYSQFELYK